MKFHIQTQVLTLIFITFLATIFALIYRYKLARANPHKASKGIIFLMETLVSKFDHFIKVNLGVKWVKNFAAYICALGYIIFAGTVVGFIHLPAATSSFSVTLTLAIVTFTIVQLSALKIQKWKYFKRFVEPSIIFLPVNLLSFWAPLISLSLRLFANVVASSLIIMLVYIFFNLISTLFFFPFSIFGIIVLPFFQAYFDVFVGFIQSAVFVSLTVIYIAQEQQN